MPKAYLGDGVYVDHNDGAIVLTAGDGIRVHDTIVLEYEVYANLVDYVAYLKKQEAKCVSNRTT